jgi:hypothetical protein
LANSSDSDSETVTAANGLHKRLKDIRIIISMEILRLVYKVIGPASRLLQGASIDLASAVVLPEDCIEQFANFRNDADSAWKTVYDRAILFATSHGLHTEFPSERRRAKKKMSGEMAGDDCLTGLARFKADTFIVVLDEAYQQMCSRFQQQNLTFMQQLSLFTPQTLLSDKSISSGEIEMICQLYGADANAVAAEMSDFKTSFKLLSQTSTATSIDGMFQGGCDDPLLGQGPSDNEKNMLMKMLMTSLCVTLATTLTFYRQEIM